MDSKLIFVIVYLIVDIIYVTLSKTYYMDIFAKIQHGDSVSFSTDKLRIIGIFGAYTAMALGWYYLAAGLADTWISEKRFSSPYIAGLLAGAIYGFAIYGTYEFTNLATISGWDYKILIIDIIWGIFVSVFSLFLTDIIYKRL